MGELTDGASNGFRPAYERLHVLDRTLTEAKLAFWPIITLESLVGKHAAYDRWYRLEDCRSRLRIALHDLHINSSDTRTRVIHLAPWQSY